MVREQTAEQLRAQAAQHEQDARESFERCDTDGFVSQWASGLNAQVARQQARIVEAGGVATFSRWLLVDAASGAAVEDAQVVRTRYGTKWRV